MGRDIKVNLRLITNATRKKVEAMERRKTYSAVSWDSRDFWWAVTYDMVHKPAHVGRKVMQPFMGSRPGFNVVQ